MTRTQLKNLFYLLYRQDSNNTEVTPTNLDTFIDLGYQKAVEDIMPDYLNTRTLTTVPQTTWVSASTATSMVVAEADGFASNTDIAVWLGSRYDIVRVNTIATETFTLDSPGLLKYASMTTSYKVAPVSFVVADQKDIIGVEWIYNTTSKREAHPMYPMRLCDKVEYATLIQSTGVPSRYGFLTETEMFIYPIPEAAGYIEMTYKNNTAYTLSADGSSVLALTADSQMAIVYWALYLTAMRNQDKDSIQLYMNMYNYTVETARKRIRNKKQGNEGWQLKPRNLDKR